MLLIISCDAAVHWRDNSASRWCNKTSVEYPERAISEKFRSHRFPGSRSHVYAQGRLSCVNGPAVYMPGLYAGWYRDGDLHRDGGPAVTHAMDPSGRTQHLHQLNKTSLHFDTPWYQHCQEWYKQGVLHREGGPAVTYSSMRCYQGCFIEECELVWYPADSDLCQNTSFGADDEISIQNRARNCSKWARKGTPRPCDCAHKYSRSYLAKHGFCDNTQANRYCVPGCRKETQAWLREGVLHRKDMPAVLRWTDKYTNPFDYSHMRHHSERELKPAILEWYENGARHRTDGDAFEHPFDWVWPMLKDCERHRRQIDRGCQGCFDRCDRCPLFKARPSCRLCPMFETRSATVPPNYKYWQGMVHAPSSSALLPEYECLYGAVVPAGTVVAPPRPIGENDVAHYRAGLLHRVEGPAIVRADGTREYWLAGLRHRCAGPVTPVVRDDSTVEAHEFVVSGARFRLGDAPKVVVDFDYTNDGQDRVYDEGLLQAPDRPVLLASLWEAYFSASIGACLPAIERPDGFNEFYHYGWPV